MERELVMGNTRQDRVRSGNFGAARMLVFLAMALAALALAMGAGASQAHADIKATGSPSLGAQAMYRLYNPNSGEHFYTSNASERGDVIRSGWNYEGVGWVRPGTGDSVYRLYNANAGEHHYTTKVAERDLLVAAGWTYEGVGWTSDAAKGVPVYREYNPNQFACNHNYTTSKAEHDKLVKLGWRDEGIAWYGSKTALPRTNAVNVNGANNNKATLRGVVVRKNETTADTMMAWGCASYHLVMPESVNVTFSDFANGTHTRATTEVHIVSNEFYTASGNARQVWLADHPWESSHKYDQYVGHEVRITGNLVNMGNAHVRGICKFTNSTITVLD